MLSRWSRVRGEGGASAVEYGLIVAGVAVALIGGASALNATASTTYRSQASAMGAEVVSDGGDGGGGGAPVDQPSSDPSGEIVAPDPTVAPTPTDQPTPTPTPTPTKTPTPTPTPTPTKTSTPKPDFTVEQDDTVKMDVLPDGMSKTGDPKVSPADAGKVDWKGDKLEFEADKKATPGLVTITFQYKKGSTVYTDTVTVLIERD